MSSFSAELDMRDRERAKEKIDAGLVNVVDKDGNGHPYVTVEPGSRYGPFKDSIEAYDYIAEASFVRAQTKGHGVWKVGHRLRFLGPNRNVWLGHKDKDKLDHQVFHIGQRMIAPGETAMIVYDHGYSYRYWMRMEKDGLLIRPGGGRWERIFEDYYSSLLVGEEIIFEHENGSHVYGVVVGPGKGPYHSSYMSVYVSASTMRELGIDRERRHREEGMTRQVLRKRLVKVGNVG